MAKRSRSPKYKYLRIEKLIRRIDGPNRSICKKILKDHWQLFERVQGSTHNHQTWPGGYIDHITDGMNFGRYLYRFMKSFRRRIPFSLSDVLLVFFLHDLEKPWRILVNEAGEVSNREGLATKEEFKAFREQKLTEYGIKLSPEQHNAFTYIEGEHKDYSSKHRVSNELAAMCHMIDTWCARGWYDYPKPKGLDEWKGADRIRTTH